MKGVIKMPLGKSWCTVEEAESKFGTKKATILKWIEDGLIRYEQSEGKVIQVNIDDLKLKTEELTRK
jgi:hypothetical protein